jgi:hypothetical protein
MKFCSKNSEKVIIFKKIIRAGILVLRLNLVIVPPQEGPARSNLHRNLGRVFLSEYIYVYTILCGEKRCGGWRERWRTSNYAISTAAIQNAGF